MNPPPVPEVLSIGPPRLAAGVNQMPQIGLTRQSVFQTLPRLTIDQLITLTEQVHLRGRGGAAFPVAPKLRAVAAAAGRQRHPVTIVVNATEGEPGSFKDHVLLRRSSYLVLGGALVVAWALRAQRVVIGVTDAWDMTRWIGALADSDPVLAETLQVIQVPDRLVAGEGSSLINAVNGKLPVPSGRRTRGSESGVGGRPTLLSNAETFAQIALLALLGPEDFASAGTPEEPGTMLLSVGGSVTRPAVVEVPLGLPLGQVLDLCGATAEHGVLVGGYHGSWLPASTAGQVPLSHAGMAASGGTLGIGVVLPLGPRTCPTGEVARVASYLADQSSGQCGPCRLGLPGIARSLSRIADGSGGVDALDTARRAAGSVQGRGACAHPDGAARFVMSALDVFTEDLTTHLFSGTCGRPVYGVLPLPTESRENRLFLDWARCEGHGLCAHIVPELIQLDHQGFPEQLDMPVPPWLEGQARQAVAMCPSLALRLEPAAAADPSARRARLMSLNAGRRRRA